MKFKLVEAVSDFNKMKKALSTYEGRLPFRYDSEYCDYIEELYAKAIDKLEKKFSNVFIEPSIQLGSGSLFATFNYDGEECTAEWDYEEESEEIDDLIVNSKSEAEFIRKLAKYIETMLLYDYAEDSDSSDPGSSDITIIPASEALYGGYLYYRGATKYSKAKHVKVEEGIIGLANGCFVSFKQLESIDLPNTLEYIDYYAFADCKKLVSIQIPDSVTEIANGLCKGCENLRDVIIGEGITELPGDWYFKSCSNLKAIMIPDSVTIMNDKMFEDCPDVIIYCNPNSYAHQYAIKHNLPTRFYADVVKDAESRMSESFFDKSLNNASYADGVKVSTNRMDKVKFPRVDTVRPITETADSKPIIPAPYDKYFEVIESEPYYYAKECSYDIAREIAQLAKRALKLPAHEVEMLEHDINNLRSNEWVEQFTQLSDKSRAKELFFRYAVEPEGYVPGDKVSGATILAEVAPKDAYVEIFDSMYNLIDNPQFPVVEIVHDRLYPVEISGKMNENFSKEFESHELLDTGELISALKALVKEYGHMELEKEIYLETVENEQGRQLKIGHSNI